MADASPNSTSPNACGRRSGDESTEDTVGAICFTIILFHHYMKEVRMKNKGADDGGGDWVWNMQ